MGNTFKDLSKVRGFSPSLIEGRAKMKDAGYKETKKDGTTRMTREGRLSTFINDSASPRPDRSKAAIKYGK